MTQLALSKRKIYQCYRCGANYVFGAGKNDKRNLNGTRHVCVASEENKERTRNFYQNKWNRWFWGYGPGAQYKKYGYYTREEYKKQRSDNSNKYRQWKQQYMNQELGLEKAGEILELEHDTILTICRERKLSDAVKLIVKKAYRRLALMWHPDRNKTEQASAMFRKITEAYERIMD